MEHSASWLRSDSLCSLGLLPPVETHEASVLISRFFIKRRPTAWSLPAPFLLYAYWVANGEKGNGQPGPPAVQECPRHRLGKVRLGWSDARMSRSRCWADSSSCPSSFRRSGTSLESESDGSTWRSRSHSDELFQPMGSSPSTDSLLMEGEEKVPWHLLVFL